VARVEGGKKLSNFGPSAFSKHETVGSHTKRLTNKPLKSNFASPFKVGLPSLNRQEMRMRHPQLSAVFDCDYSIMRGRVRKQRPKQGRFARPGGSANEKVTPGTHCGNQIAVQAAVNESGESELTQRKALGPWKTNRNQRSRSRDRRQHSVHPHTA
jgi:hypothetical protein